MPRRHVAISALLSVVLLAGCGGGGGESSQSPVDTGGEDNSFGNLITRGFTNQEPVVVNSSSVSSIGLAGSFTKVQYQDTSTSLQDTLVAYSRGALGLNIANSDFMDTAPQYGVGNSLVTRIHWHPNGKDIYYIAASNLYRSAAGSSISPLLIQSNVRDFSISPSGNSIVYINSSGQLDLWRCDNLGAGDVQLTNTVAAEDRVAYATEDRVILKTGGFFEARSATSGAATGGALSSGGTIEQLAVSADGRYYAYVDATNSQIKVGELSNDQYFHFGQNYAYPTGELGVSDLTFAPDKATLLVSCYRDAYTLNVQSGFFTRVYNAQDDGPNLYRVGWQPFGSVSTIVGVGAPNTAAAMLLYSQRADNPGAFGSLVVGDALTRSTARISSEVGTISSPYLTFTYECDKITRLAFTTSRMLSFKNVVTSAAAYNGAIVSISGSTGKVASVVPYTITRSKPSISRTAAGTVMQGSFGAVYDGEGNNIAPNGASEVTLDDSGRVTAR